MCDLLLLQLAVHTDCHLPAGNVDYENGREREREKEKEEMRRVYLSIIGRKVNPSVQVTINEAPGCDMSGKCGGRKDQRRGN